MITVQSDKESELERHIIHFVLFLSLPSLLAITNESEHFLSLSPLVGGFPPLILSVTEAPYAVPAFRACFGGFPGHSPRLNVLGLNSFPELPQPHHSSSL